MPSLGEKVVFEMSVFRTASICLLFLTASGCATFFSRTQNSESEKSAKTIFDWQIGPKDDDVESKDDDEKEKEGEPEEPEPIATDRPDFTEASSTVGRGRIQLEMGYTYSRNKETGVASAHSYPEALLRIGMFADWFEWRIAQTHNTTRAYSGEGATFSSTGGEDLYLGVKLGLTEQKKHLPETALILQMTVPTGPPGLTAGRVLAGANLLYGWDVIPDLITCGGSIQGNSAVDDDGHSYLELAESFTIGYTITRKLAAYTEIFGIQPHGATAPGTGPQYYFDGGFTYKFTNNFQYDIRAGVGLNRQSDDYFIGTGFAVRY